MFISRLVQHYLDKALGAHNHAHHCVIKGKTFAYHAMSVDVREDAPRVTMSRVAVAGVFALAMKKKVAHVTLQDWTNGNMITIRVIGSDVLAAYEFKNALHMEQIFALNSQNGMR